MQKFYSFLYMVVHPFFALLFPLRVVGRERIPDGAALLCGSHSSNWDVLFAAFALGRRCFLRFTAKMEMRKAFFLIPLMDKLGVLFINRGRVDLHAIRNILNALSSGDKVLLFPEGHRLKADDADAAKTGAIMLANRSGAPIVPLYIPRRKRLFRRNTVAFGEPYTLPKGRIDSEARAEQAHVLMRKISELGNIQ